MSQTVKIGNVELYINLGDVGFIEKYEDAFTILDEKEKKLPKTGKASQIIKSYCLLFYEFFDIVYGEGTGDRIFEGKFDSILCEKYFMQYIDACTKQSEELRKTKQELRNKYTPNKPKHYNKQQYHKKGRKH